jgi:hypothetical protein
MNPSNSLRTTPCPLNLLRLPASLFTISFTGQRLLNAQFLAGLQIKRMPFDFHDYVFLQDLPLEALERVLERLALLEPYLSQIEPPTLSRISIRVRAGTFSINCCFVILSKSTRFGIPKPGSRGPLFRIEAHHVRAALARRRTQQRFLRWERRYYSISLATAGPCPGWPTPRRKPTLPRSPFRASVRVTDHPNSKRNLGITKSGSMGFRVSLVRMRRRMTTRRSTLAGYVVRFSEPALELSKTRHDFRAEPFARRIF